MCREKLAFRSLIGHVECRGNDIFRQGICIVASFGLGNQIDKSIGFEIRAVLHFIAWAILQSMLDLSGGGASRECAPCIVARR